MTSPYSFSPQQMSFYEEVTALTLKVARPLIWRDVREPWPERLLGGTCFILRFDAGLIGVTADHVIGAFEEDQKHSAAIICLLRTVPFDLTSAIIDRDADLDIATFSVTEDQLISSEAVAIDCRSGWSPKKCTALSLAGFPEELKRVSSYRAVEFRAYASLAFVEDITDRDIISVYEPLRDSRIQAAPEFPDLGANLSGCSRA